MISQDVINKKIADLNKNSYSKGSYVKVPKLTLAKGTTIVRILPNKFSPDFPIVEKYMYYNWNGKEIFTSPITFGEPDPIAQFAAGLQDKETRKALKYNREFYAPVIVRGKEHEGVKYYKFGVEVYKQLLTYMNDEDYGDITSITEGNDISLIYTPKEETPNGFPSTSILMKPKKTTATGDANFTAELIESQIDILNNGGCLSYEQLEEKLATYIASSGQGQSTPNSSGNGTSYNDRFNNLADSKSTKETTSGVTEYSSAALDDIDDLFN